MKKQAKPEVSPSTEERIKEAARVVFTQKGYAATKTRDIAEQAGLNLALLNYYFRSKEKLFEIIMIEKIQQLFSFVAPTLNNEGMTLEEKIDWLATNYIDLCIKNPDLPLFVLSEIRNDPGRFGKIFQLETYVIKSHFIKQLAERKPGIHPVQFLISMLGMLIFPFIVKPAFESSGAVPKEAFDRMIEDRRTLIPIWMKKILE